MTPWFFISNGKVIAKVAQVERPEGWLIESEIPSGTDDPQGFRSRRPLWPSGAIPVAGAATAPQPPVLTPDYRYHATVTRVVDGDTLDLLVDCGFDTHRAIRCRLLGVNTPETKGATIEAGRKAAAYVLDWLDSHGTLNARGVIIQSRKVKTSDAFHRYLVQIWGEDGSCLNDDLLATHNAVPFRE